MDYNPTDLKYEKIFLATPMYGGQASGEYIDSVLKLQYEILKNAMSYEYQFTFNESLITRARNLLVHKFLKSDCTHLLFIDSDIRFEPKDIMMMLSLDKDIIGGPYAKKKICWDQVKTAILQNPNIEEDVLESYATSKVFAIADQDTDKSAYEPTRVKEIGTGYMLIKRDVFQMLLENSNIKYFYTDCNSTDNKIFNIEPNEKIYAFFDTAIEMDYGKERYLSEDYMFCRRWRDIGGEIHICPWAKTMHVGQYKFVSDIVAEIERS